MIVCGTALLVTVYGLVLCVYKIYSGCALTRTCKPRSDKHYQHVPIIYPLDDTLPHSDRCNNDNDDTNGQDVPERFETVPLLP